MGKATRLIGVLVVAWRATGGAAFAAPAAPAAQAAAPAGLVCQVSTSGAVVHVQAINKGTAAVPAGTSFAFTIVGPTKKTNETVTLKSALAPGKSVNVTNAIKAKNVVGCSPSA